MPRRGSFWGQPAPAPDDGEPSPLARFDEQVAVFFKGFDQWRHSLDLDARLDQWAANHEPDDPALD